MREFIAFLKLHRDYPADQIQQTVHAALEVGAASLDGALPYPYQSQVGQVHFPTLEAERFSSLAVYGNQPVNLQQYDLLATR